MIDLQKASLERIGEKSPIMANAFNCYGFAGHRTYKDTQTQILYLMPPSIL